MSKLFTSTALALAVLGTGCVTTKGKKIETDQYSRFEEGKTTRAEIVAALGEPETTNFSGSDEVLTYQFQHTDNKAMIPIVGAYMGVKVDFQLCTFTVGGKNAVLKAKACN
ncbi:MAG: hypothetical protein Q7J29_03315 [Stagnimonas sp.]|nr:hypothetical protein [Stagnimonas sp.]